MANRITTVVDIAVRDAIKNLQDTQKELGKTELSGKDLAKALQAGADAGAAEMAKLKAASNALAANLDADFIEARAAAGVSVDDMVMELNRLGASFEMIEADAKALAPALRNLDSLNVSARTAGGGMDTLRSSSDQTRSVMANLVGNSAQDLGALTGVAGSAGVAIGQLAEYAADGNITVGSLAKLAGPMVGLGLATAGVTAYFAAQKREAEELARVTQALGEIQSSLAEGDIAGASEQTAAEFSDTIAILEKYGYTAADVASVLDGYGMTTRALSNDIDDLNARQAQLQEGGLLPDELGEFEANKVAISDLEVVLGTLTEKQRLYQETAANTAGTDAAAAAIESYWSRGLEAVRANEVLGVSMEDNDKRATSHANALDSLQSQLDGYASSIEGLPEEEITEVQAAIDNGSISLAERLLAQLTRPRMINIGVRMTNAAGTSSRGSAVGSGPRGGTTGYNPGSLISDILNPEEASGGGGGGGGGGGSAADPWEEIDTAIASARAFNELTLAEYRDYLIQRLGSYDRYSADYKSIWDQIQRLNDEETKAAEDAKREQERIAKEALDAERKRIADENDLKADEFEMGDLSLAAYRQFLEGRMAAYDKYSDEYMQAWRIIQGLNDKEAQSEAAKAAAREKAEREATAAAERAENRAAMQAITAANIAGATYNQVNTGADPYSVIRAIQQYERGNGKGWRG